MSGRLTYRHDVPDVGLNIISPLLQSLQLLFELHQLTPHVLGLGHQHVLQGGPSEESVGGGALQKLVGEHCKNLVLYTSAEDVPGKDRHRECSMRRDSGGGTGTNKEMIYTVVRSPL